MIGVKERRWCQKLNTEGTPGSQSPILPAQQQHDQNNPSKCTIIQSLNCARGDATTISALHSASSNTQCFFLLLQEPWLQASGLPPYHSNFHSFYPSEKPKCVIYVKKSASIEAHTTFSHSDSYIGLYISIANLHPFTLYNFYSPGRPHSFAQLITRHNFTPAPSSILMGDFNAHHPWWSSHTFKVFSHRSIQTGNILTHPSIIIADWLHHHGFILHNKPGIPTFFHRSQNSSSVIDLSLSSGIISQKVISWGLDQNTTSDHSLCWLQLDISPPSISQSKPNWYKADWTQLRTMISEATDHITSPPIDLAIDYHHALDNVNCLLQAIKNAVTTCVPLKTCTHHSTPWWCHNLTIMKRHATLATRQARLHNTNETRANAKQQRATLLLII